MSEDPKPDYEAPSVDEVETDDRPAVTAAGDGSPVDEVPSDLRLKHSLYPLDTAITDSEASDYEAPSVDEVATDDSPAVTAAGVDSPVESDLRLKHSLRPLRPIATATLREGTR